MMFFQPQPQPKPDLLRYLPAGLVISGAIATFAVLQFQVSAHDDEIEISKRQRGEFALKMAEVDQIKINMPAAGAITGLGKDIEYIKQRQESLEVILRQKELAETAAREKLLDKIDALGDLLSSSERNKSR